MLDAFTQWLDALKNVANMQKEQADLVVRMQEIERCLKEMEDRWATESESIIAELKRRDTRTNQELQDLWEKTDRIIDGLESIANTHQNNENRKRAKSLVHKLKYNRTRMQNRQGAA